MTQKEFNQAAIAPGTRTTFTGQVAGYQVQAKQDQHHYIYRYDPAIVLRNIQCQHQLVLPQTVFNYSKIFWKLGYLPSGTILQFNATLVAANENASQLYSHHLVHPTKLQIVHRTATTPSKLVPFNNHDALVGMIMEQNQHTKTTKSLVYDRFVQSYHDWVHQQTSQRSDQR